MQVVGCSLGDLELAQPISIKSRFVNAFFRVTNDPCWRCGDEGGDVLFGSGGAIKQVNASYAPLDESSKFVNNWVSSYISGLANVRG